MIRTAINWIGSAFVVLLLVAFLVGALFSKSPHSSLGVAFWFMCLFWTVGAAIGLFGPLLKKQIGNLAFGCFVLGFAVIAIGMAFNVFVEDPTKKFRGDGNRHDWVSDLIGILYREYGPWGASVFFGVVALFFAWITIMSFREKSNVKSNIDERA